MNPMCLTSHPRHASQPSPRRAAPRREIRVILQGFTLIELLIVVAIIAILAAIAVPNFLEAQIRSKTSRVKSDMRSMSVAINAYRVDYSKYPYQDYTYIWVGNVLQCAHSLKLTTPIAYMTSLPSQPFGTKAGRFNGWAGILNDKDRPKSGGLELGYPFDTNNRPKTGNMAYPYDQLAYPWAQAAFGSIWIDWSLAACGPNNAWGPAFGDVAGGLNGDNASGTYDPTNGTVSAGNFWLCEKGFASR